MLAAVVIIVKREQTAVAVTKGGCLVDVVGCNVRSQLCITACTLLMYTAVKSITS